MSPYPIPISKDQQEFIKNSPTLTIKEKCKHTGLSIWVVTTFMQKNNIPSTRTRNNRFQECKIMEGYFNTEAYAKQAII